MTSPESHGMNSVLQLSAREQAALIAEKEISPVELCTATLERIEQDDPELGAFITMAPEQALEAAKQAEARAVSGELRSALDGVPIGIKDIEATAGIRTTLGSRYFENMVPDFDSVVVERVRAAGMVIVGKTNTPEIAIHMDTVTDNEVRGPCKNPWNRARTTAGSSGGSAAALAAGLLQVAIGSDGGGSIRIPASFCGVFGMKPTNGRVPRARGLGRPDPNQFSQSGPMTNDVQDAALLLQAIAGPHPEDPQQFMRTDPPNFSEGISQGVDGVRIGFSSDFGYGAIDPHVLEQVKLGLAALADSGAHVEDADITLDYEYADRFWSVFGANAYTQYGHMFEESPEKLTEGVREVLKKGKEISGHEYASALRSVNELRTKFDSLFNRYDLIITPTTSITAFEPGKRPTEVAGMKVDSAYGVFPFTYIFNMTGNPAASVPCGFAEGLPVGIQIAGRFGDEQSVFRASRTIEQALAWPLAPYPG